MLDDPEENSIVSRVIQAVGLFGDILSLEDTMEPILSESKGEDEAENTGGTASGEEESPQQADDKMVEEEEMLKDKVMMEEDGEGQVGHKGGGQQVEEWKDKNESKEGKEEEKEHDYELQQGEKEEEVEQEGLNAGVKKTQTRMKKVENTRSIQPLH